MKIIIAIFLLMLVPSLCFGEIFMQGYTNPANMPDFERLGSGFPYFKICATKDKASGVFGCIEVKRLIGSSSDNKDVWIRYDHGIPITEFLRILNTEYFKED